MYMCYIDVVLIFILVFTALIVRYINTVLVYTLDIYINPHTYYNYIKYTTLILGQY